MSDIEMQEKALPGYTGLAVQQKVTNDKIDELIILTREANDPQHSLLAQLLKLERCRKKNENKHRSNGMILSVVALGFGVIALVIDSLNRGETSIFLTGFKWGKGLFGL